MKRALLFASLFPLLACSSEVRTDVTNTSQGSGGGGGSASSSGVGASWDAGGAPLEPCLPPDAPPSPAPLCGPPDAPCQVLVDELLPVAPAFRNDAPAISLDKACAPSLLFSVAENGLYNGFFARRNAPDDWSVSPTPFALATAGLGTYGDGRPFAFPNDGAFGAGLWALEGDAWTSLADVPKKVTHSAHGFAQANNGAILAAFRTDIDELVLGSFDGAWSLSQIGQTPYAPLVALSPEGWPHVAAWSAESGSWALHWYAPPSNAELPMLVGGTLQAEVLPFALAATAADPQNPQGKPHLLWLSQLPDFTFNLMYAVRVHENTWSVVPVEYAAEGATYRPLGIVTDDSGDVRLFYTRAKASAPGEEQVVVAWPGVGKAVLFEGRNALGATFQRDGAGRIHVAMYTVSEPSKFDVRYVLLGP
jgi:hypothetical protein